MFKNKEVPLNFIFSKGYFLTMTPSNSLNSPEPKESNKDVRHKVIYCSEENQLALERNSYKSWQYWFHGRIYNNSQKFIVHLIISQAPLQFKHFFCKKNFHIAQLYQVYLHDEDIIQYALFCCLNFPMKFRCCFKV